MCDVHTGVSVLDDECASVPGFDVDTTFLNGQRFPEVRGKVLRKASARLIAQDT